MASGGEATRSGSMIGSRGTRAAAVNSMPLTRIARCSISVVPPSLVKIVVSELMVIGAGKPGASNVSVSVPGRDDGCAPSRPGAPPPPGGGR